jgi:hypothetical protein
MNAFITSSCPTVTQCDYEDFSMKFARAIDDEENERDGKPTSLQRIT